jgi:hypothetical protein
VVAENDGIRSRAIHQEGIEPRIKSPIGDRKIGFHLDRDAGDPEIAADFHLVQWVTVLQHWD